MSIHYIILNKLQLILGAGVSQVSSARFNLTLVQRAHKLIHELAKNPGSSVNVGKSRACWTNLDNTAHLPLLQLIPTIRFLIFLLLVPSDHCIRCLLGVRSRTIFLDLTMPQPVQLNIFFQAVSELISSTLLPQEDQIRK